MADGGTQVTIALTRRGFTVEEYHRMAEAGILHEDDRVELVEGEIVEMTPIGSRHASCVAGLTMLLPGLVSGRAVVWVQNPVRLGARSEPQPDVALLRRRPDRYASGHPGPADVLLLIEVADASLATDRAVKVPLYARAGIPEVWLVDLGGEAVEVYREPGPAGYGRVERVGRGGRLTPLALPDLALEVNDILG